MAMVRMTQAEEVQQVLGCSFLEALHYLRIFDGNQERAVRVVLQHMEDKDWWGHPWNRRSSWMMIPRYLVTMFSFCPPLLLNIHITT